MTLAPVLNAFERETTTQIASYVSAHPADISKLLVSPPRASDVTASWTELAPAQQKRDLTAAPQVFGNLDGIPYSARARANATQLAREIRSTRQEVKTTLGKGARFAAEQQLDTLEEIRDALKPTKGGPPRSLLIFDTTTAEIRAAVAVGDLSTAKYISYLVPGMYMSVNEQIVDWAQTAQQLYTSQRSWLKRTATERPEDAHASVATVAWIGYQTPELMNIGGMQLALEGANYLENELAGLQSVRRADPPFVSVMAHSYGSTAALIALQRHTVRVDALALLGSPGSAAQSARDLDVANGNVYVAQARLDPVVHSAFFGSDPGSQSYGAHEMSVRGGIDPIDHQRLSASYGHNEYFTEGSESMRNLALIGINLGSLVTAPSGANPTINASSK